MFFFQYERNYNKQSMNDDFDRFFSSLPNGANVSEVKRLSSFIRNYPNEDLHPQMYKLQEEFHFYRAIKGDGNCFYRACIFLYLCKADLSNYSSLFPKTPIFDCLDLPFYNQDNYSSEALLQFIWRKYLKPMERQTSAVREKRLEVLFNSSEMFDVVMVSYFRSLNHQYIKSNRDKFERYVDNGLQNQLKKVLTFGKESEGVQIFTLAELLGVTIRIKMTLQSTVKEEIYNQHGRFIFVLFYRPGHYDILPTDYQPIRQSVQLNVRSNSKSPVSLISSGVKSNFRHSSTEVVIVNRPEHLVNAKSTIHENKPQNQNRNININEFLKHQSRKNNSIISNNMDQFTEKKRGQTYNREYSTSTIGKYADPTKHALAVEGDSQANLKNPQLKSSSRKPTVNSTKILVEAGMMILGIGLIIFGCTQF